VNPYEPPPSTPKPPEDERAIDVQFGPGTEMTLANFGCSMLAIGVAMVLLIAVIDWVTATFLE